MDLDLLRFMNQTIASPLLDGVMVVVTYAGLALCPALGLILLMGPRRRHLGLGLLTAIGVSLLITLVFQYAALRPRPEAVRLVWPAPNFPAFPSGHAAIVFATAAVLSLAARRRAVTVGTFTAAVLIAISRVYLGVHYPSDVLAGAVLGGGVGAASYGLLVAPAGSAEQRLRWLLWLHAALVVVISLMAYLGLLPRAMLTWPGADKVLHALLFGAIAFWLNLWLAPEARTWRGLPVAVVAPFALALLEEALQALSPLRTADVGDLAGDLIGMVALWRLSERLLQGGLSARRRAAGPSLRTTPPSRP